MKLDGSKILVTGASSGIGAALAPQLAEKGATVGIVARRAERLEEVVAQCRVHTPDSVFWAADLGDVDRAVSVALDAWEVFGGLDALVNNAAIGKRKLVQTLTPEDVDVTMRTNFFSPVRMGMALLPRWLERGRGLIVNVSSMGGRVGILHEAAYSASKFALCGWSESMRLDLDGTGVQVKLVLPGPIETEIWEVQPGELPGLYDGPFVSAADCAADIVAAMEDEEGFEYYTPEEVPGGWRQKDLVVGKTQSCDDFLTGMARMG
ncbi:MAG: SDR family NAD(P)-dependent oxidoreductase [Acidimicrobiia bacterium]